MTILNEYEVEKYIRRQCYGGQSKHSLFRKITAISVSFVFFISILVVWLPKITIIIPVVPRALTIYGMVIFLAIVILAKRHLFNKRYEPDIGMFIAALWEVGFFTLPLLFLAIKQCNEL